MIGGVSAVKYFHLQIKPTMGAKSREAREIYCLLQGLDLLRSGKLDHLGDLMAARAMAVHQSVTDGGSWRAARHLEIRPLETGTAANTSLILQARKFAKVSDRAAGLNPARTWVPRPYGKGSKDWGDEADSYRDFKGKGRGKKGKGKGDKGKKPWKESGQKDWASTQAPPPGKDDN